jgi:hypothetical protein
MLLLKKKKYAAVTMEKKANGELVCHTELKGANRDCNIDLYNSLYEY